MTRWDARAAARALGAALLALAVMWLATAASDEGQLAAGARAGRTLPLAPVASAVGAALALGAGRVRSELRALEALGRPPAIAARWSALGAAIPSLVVAAAVGLLPSIDLGGFYPRAAHADVFVATDTGFTSPTLALYIDANGNAEPIEAAPPVSDGEPQFARASAALATALAGVALALVAAHAVLRPSLLDARAQRRRRAWALGAAFGCAALTLVAFQAAASHRAPALLATAPPLALLVLALAQPRTNHDVAEE